VHNLTLSLADRYNPMFALTDRRLWGDCYRDRPGGLGCSGANPYNTNGDGIVQDWEVGPSGLSNFGARAVNRMDPDVKRDYYIRMGLGVDHQLLPRVSVSAGWYWTDYRNQRTTRNTLRTLADYDAFQVANPLPGYAGQQITVYNLKRDKLGAVDNLDTNSKERSTIYNGFVFSMRARLPGGGTVFGGLTAERTTDVNCDSPDNPNTYRFCDTSGGDGEIIALASVPRAGPPSGVQATMPYQSSVKLGADYPLPYGVQLSAAYRIVPGVERGITWSVPASAFTAAGLSRTQTVTVRLNPPGSLYLDRLNLLDLSAGKWFNLPGRLRVKVAANVYNLLNPDTVTSRTNTFGATLGTPTGVILGRFWRASTQLEW
jgi:hypothetical protein